MTTIATFTKKCSRCRKDKPHTAFNLSRRSKDFLQAYCTACVKEYQRERSKETAGQEAPPAVVERMEKAGMLQEPDTEPKPDTNARICTECQEEKPGKDFLSAEVSLCRDCLAALNGLNL